MDFEKAFAELQKVHHEHTDACDAYDRVCDIVDGDTDFCLIHKFHVERKSKRPRHDTFSELAALQADCKARLTRLSSRETELYERLSTAGYDMRHFYATHYIAPEVANAEKDVAEKAFRLAVDKKLSASNPVIINESEYLSTVQAKGASGYMHTVSEEEEAAGVDALVEVDLLENDVKPDTLRVFSDDSDALNKTKPDMLCTTGAVWHRGFRISLEMQDELLEHQFECLEFLLNAFLCKSGAIVAHAMGLGKTLTALAVLQVYKSRCKLQCIVTCPKGMIEPWAHEAEAWPSFLDVECYPIMSKECMARDFKRWQRHGGILIVGHDAFRTFMNEDVEVATSVDTDELVLIVDEAHLLLKSASTQMYVTINSLKTHHKVLMTGTAMQNNLKEYYTMVNLVAPGILGNSVMEFNKLYGSAIEKGMMRDSSDDDIITSERTVQMLLYRVEHVMHRRSASLLRLTLPKKKEFRLLHPAPTDDGGVCSFGGGGVIEERHEVAKACRDIKAKLTIELIDSIQAMSPQESIVVFSPYLESLKLLSQLRAGDVYTGETNSGKRSDMKSAFNATSGLIMYVATKAGGVGINLTKGSRVILFDASWNPCDDVQAIARCYRMGQKKGVIVYRLIAANTLEERLYRMQVQKHAMAARVLEEQDIRRVYNKDDLKRTAANCDDVCPLLANKKVIALDSALFCACKAFEAVGVGSILVSDHAKLFSEDDVDMSEVERARARNEMQLMVRSTPRFLPAPDDSICKVEVGQCFFADHADFADTFVPPYQPYFEKPCADTKLGWKPAIDFSNQEQVYVRLGPFFDCRDSVPIRSKDPMRFDVRFCRMDEDSPKWQKWQTQYIAHSVDGKDTHICLGAMEAGEYVFKARFLDLASREESAWSEDSSSLTVWEIGTVRE